MGYDPGVTFLLDNLLLDGGIVNESKLWVGLFGDVGKEIFSKIHSDSEALQNVHSQNIALPVKLVYGLAESGELGVCWTGGITKATMLIALLMVYPTICFVAIASVTLV